MELYEEKNEITDTALVQENHDIKEIPKPDKQKRNVWQNTIRQIKGENVAQLVEDFTAEMTLVAEGLVDDQSKLHQKMEGVQREQDKASQRLESGQQALESDFTSLQQECDKSINQLTKRVSALENQLNAITKAAEEDKKAQQKKEEKLKGDKQPFMQQLIVLVSILAGSGVIIAILRLFS